MTALRNDFACHVLRDRLDHIRDFGAQRLLAADGKDRHLNLAVFQRCCLVNRLKSGPVNAQRSKNPFRATKATEGSSMDSSVIDAGSAVAPS